MRKSSVYDCSVIELPRVENRAGNLTPVHSRQEIPFNIERIYYLYDVPGGASRGGHAHKKLQQLIVAASGSFDVILDDGHNKRTVHLNRPYYGLLLPRLIWRELVNFSSGGICLVLASRRYDPDDYLREYENYIGYKQSAAS